MSEIELKFLIENPQQVSAILEAVREKTGCSTTADVVHIREIYVDTDDLQLYRNGLLCRWRVECGGCTFNVVSRDTPVKGRCQAATEDPVTSLPDNVNDIPSGPAGKKVKAIVKTSKLGELFQIHRQRRKLSDRPKPCKSIVWEVDETTIEAPRTHRKTAPQKLWFEELCLKSNECQSEVVRELANTLTERFDLLPARLGDFERGAQAAGLDLSETDGEALKLRRKDPIIKLVYQYLAQELTQVMFHEPRAWEALDPEGVHQMRVATRRIRAMLATFKPILPQGKVKRVNREFRWLARLLGDVRDLDVYLINFDHYTKEMPGAVAESLSPYRIHLNDRRLAARKRLIAGLSSTQFDSLINLFRHFCGDGLSSKKRKRSSSDSIRQAAIGMIDHRLKKVQKSGRSVTENSRSKNLHAVRIQVKRLRYLLEFFRPFYRKHLKSLIRATKTIQEILGDFQDACVASNQLQTYADSLSKTEENRGLLDALDCLIASQSAHARQQRDSFPTAWAEFDQPQRRKKLRKLLGS